MNLTIRQAKKEDLPAVLSLFSQPGVDDGEVLSVEAAERIFDKMQSYPNYNLYVAVRNNSIIGSFALLIIDNLAHMGASSGIVEDVMVSPSHQGQGVGREMMKYAQDISREAGCYKLVVSSNKKRKEAHRFFETMGFKKHGYSFLIDL
jgi:GNAT superfamily N-acetyltransferase